MRCDFVLIGFSEDKIKIKIPQNQLLKRRADALVRALGYQPVDVGSVPMSSHTKDSIDGIHSFLT